MRYTRYVRFLLSLALLIVISQLSHAVPLGTAFTYQGQLTSGGAPANGNYDLALALFDDPSFGSQVGSTVTNLNVAVSNGVFVTTIDFGAGIFTGTAYWLAIGVRSNGSGVAFASLTPRQALTPSPYALYATAAALADGAVTSAKILDSTIANADLANNAVNSAKIADGTVANADLANDAVNSAKILDATILGADIANNTVGSAQLADTIALGDSNTLGRLDVFYANTLSNQPAISLIGGSRQISTYGSDGREQTRIWGPSWGELLLKNSGTNNATAVLLTANSSSGGYLSLNNSNGSVRARLDGLNSGGSLTLYQADGGVGAFIDGESGGAGTFDLRSTNGSIRVFLDADAGDGGGLLQVRNASGATKVQLDGQSTSSAGEISLLDASGNETMQIIGAETSTSGAEIRLRTTLGADTLEFDGEYAGHGNAGAILLYKTNGASTIQIYADYAGSGDGRIVTQELQITGGSDLSEQFDITPLAEATRPGMVVCIDPKKPGQLIPSTRAYDRTVAGVISGAGGVKPGMLMGQKGTAADGQHPVALTGRVYCWVDAAHGAIQPGDLITTSDTPGHAMRVVDHAQAQGAILGKAMTGLEEGKGLVLVLVSLQ